MKTAPKDATVLLYSRSLAHVIGHWNRKGKDEAHLSNWITAWDGMRLATTPSHWMPLPEPPK
jgi:hypothetical protein